MGESKIKFGDKLFLYGQFLQFLPEDGEFMYNMVTGYMTIGNDSVMNVDSVSNDRSIPGFVVDFLSQASLATETPFSDAGMVDVTDNLVRRLPSPTGTKVWMPTTLK